jgi:proteasome lid subunit RPN8/RPN11
MEATIHISKAALDYFREKARNSANEIQAYLVGDVHYPNHINVTSIEHPRGYHQQTKCNVQVSGEEFDRIKALAQYQGHRIVGDIHSHPNEEPIMSPRDYQAAIIDGLHVVGIVSVIKRKTKVLFWLSGSPLPCEVSYEAYRETENGTN